MDVSFLEKIKKIANPESDRRLVSDQESLDSSDAHIALKLLQRDQDHHIKSDGH